LFFFPPPGGGGPDVWGFFFFFSFFFFFFSPKKIFFFFSFPFPPPLICQGFSFFLIFFFFFLLLGKKNSERGTISWARIPIKKRAPFLSHISLLLRRPRKPAEDNGNHCTHTPRAPPPFSCSEVFVAIFFFGESSWRGKIFFGVWGGPGPFSFNPAPTGGEHPRA